jgi:hypothetical protein
MGARHQRQRFVQNAALGNGEGERFGRHRHGAAP